MGRICEPQPVLLIVAAFSREKAALEWVRARAESAWGPVTLSSDEFEFDQTDYYAASMGSGLVKRFFACEPLIKPGRLAAIKRETNAWEDEYAHSAGLALSRPLNIDPGYITQAKLILASTKDHAHRLYLADGIYAEVTLQFVHSEWRPLAWTFPDYRRAEYHEFFSACRAYLRGKLADASQGDCT